MDDGTPTPAEATAREAIEMGWSGGTWGVAVVGWHAAFWIVLALGLANAWVGTTDGDRAGPAVQVAILLTMGAAYLLAAPQLGQAHVSWRMWLYIVVAIAGVGVACWSDGTLSLLLFIVYPQMWIFAGRRTWVGVALNVALTVSSLIGFVTAYGGFSRRALRDIGPQMTVSLLFSVLLGLWVSRIVQQSIERGQLIAELEATRTALAAAHHEQGVMAERERMAREIHDTLAQGFTSIVMLAQAASAARDAQRRTERLSMIEEVARDNLAEARALVAAFGPVDLSGSDLAQALRRLADRFGRETGLEVEVGLDGDGGGLSRDQQVVLLRVVQEALTNVRRHARARRVRIRLAHDDQGARLEVLDDGVGFAPERSGDPQAAGREGFGLAGMRARLHEVGGQVDVASSPGSGTLVQVRVPSGSATGEDTTDRSPYERDGGDGTTDDRREALR